MGSLHLKMIRAVQFFLLCLVSKDISAEPSPDPLDTVNVHLHLGEIEKAAAMKESESAGATGKKGSDYGYHPSPCASPPCKTDDGDTNNSGNNCAGVTCTGKRSGINIKCCGDDFRKIRMKKRKRRS